MKESEIIRELNLAYDGIVLKCRDLVLIEETEDDVNIEMTIHTSDKREITSEIQEFVSEEISQILASGLEIYKENHNID